MKTWKKVLIVLLILSGISGYLVYDAFKAAPKRYTARYVTLSSSRISSQLNGMNILFFSDLDYGTYMDEERLNNLVNKINQQAPDVVLFGGDVYDYAASPDKSSNQIITKAFQKIHAEYGKFAVYGDVDDQSDEMKKTVNSIYANSDFEVLNNASASIHRGSSQSFTLVGLDNGLNGKPDINTAYSNVSRNNYVITVCHTPDTADKVPGDLTNYFLAGHSHGGQAYWFFGAAYTPAMATEYLRGKHSIANDFTLDITNGVGTTGKDVRFLAPAEIVVYQLKSSRSEATPQSTSSTKKKTEAKATTTPETSPASEATTSPEATADSTQSE